MLDSRFLIKCRVIHIVIYTLGATIITLACALLMLCRVDIHHYYNNL